MIDVTLIGTSALLPLPDRALTAVALTCNGRTILFDCGEGTQSAARAAHVNLMRTDFIALTHYHGDHIFGLPGLLQSLSQMGRQTPLTIIGPHGIDDELAPIMTLTGPISFSVQRMEMPSDGLRFAAIHPKWPPTARLDAFPTQHRVISQGYAFTLSRPGKFMAERAAALHIPVPFWKRLQNGETVEADGKRYQPSDVLSPDRKGLRIVFSGDTTACDSLLHAADDADLLISEATYGEDCQADMALSRGHMTFAQAGQLAAKAAVRALWLTHFSQAIDNPQSCLEHAQVFFPKAVCGYDGLAATLSFDTPLQLQETQS